MSKAKMEAARELIKEKQYTAARSILVTMPGEPLALDWLAKLDRITPPQTEIARPPGKSRKRVWPVALLVVIILIVAASGAALLLLRTPGSASLAETYSDHGIAFKYPTGWTVVGAPLSITLFSSPKSYDDSFIIFAADQSLQTYDSLVDVDKDCKNQKLMQDGLIGSDGTVTLKPDGQFLPVTQWASGDLKGVSCGYGSGDASFKTVFIRINDTTRLAATAYTNSVTSTGPLLDQIVASLQIDASQIGNFGKLIIPTPTAP